jgi:hypothetical protein
LLYPQCVIIEFDLEFDHTSNDTTSKYVCLLISSLCVPMVERSGLMFIFTPNRVYYPMSLEIA